MAEKQSTDQWFASAPLTDSGDALPEWYQQLQASSWKQFCENSGPTRLDQNWRFADLKKARLSGLVTAPVVDAESSINRALNNRPEAYAAHFVFVNNRLVHSESGSLPEGVICLPINEALVKHPDLVQSYFLKEEGCLGGSKFRQIHAAATLSGVFIHVPRGVVCEDPILVNHFVGGDGSTIFPHTLVVAEDNTSVSLMDTFQSIQENEGTFAIGNVDLYADNGAKIQYVAFQDSSDLGAKHVQMNSSKAGRDSAIKSAFVNLGAAWVRNESINHMSGTGADCQIYSANLASGIQEYDQRTLQVHEAQHTTSDLLFKNAIYDEARTIFSGLIQVLPGSHHTDSYQTCRNLLGSKTAEANAMPGLEIDADQVKCSHGSTSGQISDEEIFYLQARGITAEDARRIISLGFLNETVSRLDGDKLKEFLFSRIERKFASLA
ncbi:SufD family Fe-S cluster assembly protein [Verrucomicrobiales bacterium BCK34]|nr:SufD family Fe-S cluster assembly protein [Verrucomicrobiales bacterium BCK34]